MRSNYPRIGRADYYAVGDLIDYLPDTYDDILIKTATRYTLRHPHMTEETLCLP